MEASHSDISGMAGEYWPQSSKVSISTLGYANKKCTSGVLKHLSSYLKRLAKHECQGDLDQRILFLSCFGGLQRQQKENGDRH